MYINKLSEITTIVYNLLSDNNFSYQIIKTIELSDINKTSLVCFVKNSNNIDFGVIQLENNIVQDFLNEFCSDYDKQLIIKDFEFICSKI